MVSRCRDFYYFYLDVLDQEVQSLMFPRFCFCMYMHYNSITTHTRPRPASAGVKDTENYLYLHTIPVDAMHGAHASALARCLCHA